MTHTHTHTHTIRLKGSTSVFQAVAQLYKIKHIRTPTPRTLLPSIYYTESVDSIIVGYHFNFYTCIILCYLHVCIVYNIHVHVSTHTYHIIHFNFYIIILPTCMYSVLVNDHTCIYTQ